MKTPWLLLFLSISSTGLAEDPLKLDHLKLKTGKEYDKVVVTQKRPDGISIMHEGGTARIKFEELPDDLANTLGGFDKEAATKARADADAQESAALAEIERGLEVMKKDAASKESYKALVAASRPAVLKVVQATPEGLLCHIAWFQDQKVGHTSTDSFGRNVTT